MLSNLKKKLGSAIREGILISDSLQQQYNKLVDDTDRSLKAVINETQKSDLAAGCNILSKYENDWRNVHEFNEGNIIQAANVATHLANIEKCALIQETALKELNTSLSGIPELIIKLGTSFKILSQIEMLCSQITKELEHLEDLCEECNLQEFMLDQRFKLSEHKQQKMKELEDFRQKIAIKHNHKMKQHDDRLRQIQRERQAVFAEEFRCDLEEYKQKGVLSKIESKHEKLQLEDVVLDVKVGARDSLEEFLDA